MNWDQQALEAWLEQTAQKDDDVMTMQKYAQADQSRIKVGNKQHNVAFKNFNACIGHEFKTRTAT